MESGNSGITKPCPECKEVAIKALQIVGSVVGVIKFIARCPHCQKDIYIEIGQKPYIKIIERIKMLAILFLIVSTALSMILLKDLTTQVTYLMQTYDVHTN